MVTFESLGVAPGILKSIGELGFEQPMPVQEAVLPVLLHEPVDLVVLAQTGTGKTAAFGIPLIQRIDTQSKNIQSLILCPTRELCLQITNDLTKFSKHEQNMHITAVYGGASIEAQIRELKNGVHILIATPGRLIDLIQRKKADLTHVSTVVLDEADEMLNMGFRDDLDTILTQVPPGRTTLLFSATMPQDVARISAKYMNHPKEITIGKKNAGNENVQHFYTMVHAKDKFAALRRLADVYPESYGIIFCRTRSETRDVTDKLIAAGYNADSLHGDLSQAQRDSVMSRFRVRNIQWLVATDVAARGLDVNDLTHVIHFSLPDDVEVYTHRSGRTGRAGKKGISIALANLREKHILSKIEKIIKKELVRMLIPDGAEICRQQLMYLVDKVVNAENRSEEVDKFLPEIMPQLMGLEKEELIARFISLEFSRFANDYKNAEDLNVSDRSKERPGRSESGRRDSRDSRGDRFERNDRRNDDFGGDDFVKFSINMGKRDGANPRQLISMLNDTMSHRSFRIGRIDLDKSYSYFEVERNVSSDISHAFRNVYVEGRKIEVKQMLSKLESERAYPEKGRRRRVKF